MKTLNEYMQNKKQDMVDLEVLLTKHVAIAPEGGGDGETQKADALEHWLIEKGFADIQRIEAPDSRVSSGKRPNIIVTIPGKKDDYSIWVIAHIDVVPAGDLKLWNTNPWEVVEKDGKLFGRGVEDDQQGLVSQTFAALYYLENDIKPEHTIKLLFAADEENGSEYGVIYLLKNYDLFKKDDLVIIPDGGDPRGETIEIAEKNILWLEFHVQGEQTHGSRPDSGKNACLAACDLTMRLHALEKLFNKKDILFTPDYSTFQPTKRNKNVDSINIIPGEDTFCMDCRILPCYSLSEVLSQIDKLCAEVENEYKVKVQYTTLQKSESPATDKNALVVQKLSAAIKQIHNIDVKCIGIGGGTVAAELRRKGIDAAVWSTLDDQAHQPNEYCKIDNIIADAKTLVTLFGQE